MENISYLKHCAQRMLKQSHLSEAFETAFTFPLQQAKDAADALLDTYKPSDVTFTQCTFQSRAKLDSKRYKFLCEDVLGKTFHLDGKFSSQGFTPFFAYIKNSEVAFYNGSLSDLFEFRNVAKPAHFTISDTVEEQMLHGVLASNAALRAAASPQAKQVAKRHKKHLHKPKRKEHAPAKQAEVLVATNAKPTEKIDAQARFAPKASFLKMTCVYNKPLIQLYAKHKS